MAISIGLWPEIVHKALRKKSELNLAACRRLESEGVDDDEIMRRVYFPWKTLEQYRQMKSDYNALFGGG